MSGDSDTTRLPDNAARGRSLQSLFRESAAALERETTEAWERHLAGCLTATREARDDEEPLLGAANALRKLRRHAEAVDLLRKGLLASSTARIHHCYSRLLEECNRTEEAIEAAKSGLRDFPNDFLLRLKAALLLPVLYGSTTEIDRWRGRFAEGLERIGKEVRLETAEQRHQALIGIGHHVNRYLGYQGRNDRDLQVRYGALVLRCMAASYPDWTRPLCVPPVGSREALRIGYISARFRDLTATRFFLGWLREHDRMRFAVHVWHIGEKTDDVTEEARRISVSFHHIPGGPPEIARSVRAHNLHVLAFLDVGLDPIMTQMAALRLAPVQCMAWDQPITSGLPTMDYFLSGSLAEASEPEDHYSEQLIRLPGIGVCLSKPVIPTPLLTKSREDFHLREDATLYLCCQAVYKFLPQTDSVLVEIAKRVPRAQFVFTVANELVAADLKHRLNDSFGAAGLRAADYCIILSEFNRLNYWNLNLVADVFLDTIGWSSAASVLDAVSCRVPVVTLPGELMRSRQGAAILTQLDVPATIARDSSEYVEIAVRLGKDPSFRQGIVERMTRNQVLLFSDKRPVRDLEEFFQSVCSNRVAAHVFPLQ